MILSIIYLLVRCVLGCLMARARREVPEDAELLVLRHENAVLRRQITKVRYQPAGRLWLAALSRLIPRHRWSDVLAVTPATLPPGTGDWSHVNGTTRTGGVPDGRPPQPRSARS